MIPYVLPFVLYLGLIQLPAAYPATYAWSYPAVVLAVGVATIALLWGRGLLRPPPRVLPGVLVGLVGIALWIGLCSLDLEQQLAVYLPALLRPGPRPGFDPFTTLPEPAERWVFLSARFAGLVLLIPVVEELFWRGFLLRWLISPDWEKQPLGQFTWPSFAGVTLLFTLVHPEWLAAAVYAALLNCLMYWKRDLWNCVVAHGVSNLVLFVYVLATGTWKLW